MTYTYEIRNDYWAGDDLAFANYHQGQQFEEERNDEHMDTFDTYEEALWAIQNDPAYMNQICIRKYGVSILETHLHRFELDEWGFPIDWDDEMWERLYIPDRTGVYFDGKETVFDTFNEAKSYALGLLNGRESDEHYSEIEYEDFDTPEAYEGCRFDDMNYLRRMER